MTEQESRDGAPEVRERAVRMVFKQEGDHASQRPSSASPAAPAPFETAS